MLLWIFPCRGADGSISVSLRSRCPLSVGRCSSRRESAAFYGPGLFEAVEMRPVRSRSYRVCGEDRQHPLSSVRHSGVRSPAWRRAWGILPLQVGCTIDENTFCHTRQRGATSSRYLLPELLRTQFSDWCHDSGCPSRNTGLNDTGPWQME